MDPPPPLPVQLRFELYFFSSLDDKAIKAKYLKMKVVYACQIKHECQKQVQLKKQVVYL